MYGPVDKGAQVMWSFALVLAGVAFLWILNPSMYALAVFLPIFSALFALVWNSWLVGPVAALVLWLAPVAATFGLTNLDINDGLTRFWIAYAVISGLLGSVVAKLITLVRRRGKVCRAK